jgi:hypothetical protein
MKPVILQNNLYTFNYYFLIEKMFSLIKNIFSKKTEIVLNQYIHLIELSAEPIVILDQDRIIFANKPAINLFEADNEES